MNFQHNIFEKYDVQIPRYTSYPTVPHWKNNLNTKEWITHLNNSFSTYPDWSMYLHIPFCETLCTFCGCTNIITKNHGKEFAYIDLLINELDMYLEKIPNMALSNLTHIHLGGGSPTFLSPENTRILLEKLTKRLKINYNNFKGSVEVDPRRCKTEHLKVYSSFGFNRLSLGVQDFSPLVQKIINRHQTYEQTEKVFNAGRKLGFNSINLDLIYGLPLQTIESMTDTITKTLILNPERIALYSYAKVPWIKPQQKLFSDADLPQGIEKSKLYDVARNLLIKAGYKDIGMDHFALPSDELAIAQKNNSLFRNFMGYVESKSSILLGLGMSSISDCGNAFHQNHKTLQTYTDSVSQNQIPTLKGHILSSEDLTHREKIIKLITQFEIMLDSGAEVEDAKDYLKDMISDGLVLISNQKLEVTTEGRPFLRNVCSLFDYYYRNTKGTTNLYSKSI